MPEAHARKIVLAVLTRPHGLEGALHAKVFNPDTRALVQGARVWVGPPEKQVSMTLSLVRRREPTWIVAFEEIRTVAEAEKLRNAEVSLERDRLEPLEEGEFYHADLVGCAVYGRDDRRVGTVREVIHYPSVDALMVDASDGKTFEVPCVDGIVTRIDVGARRIDVDEQTLSEPD